jgi:hypothetical protein
MMLSSHDDYAVQNLYHTLGPVADVIRAYPNALELAVNRPGEVQVELDNGTWLGVEAPNVTADTLHSMALAVAKHTAQSFNERNAVLFGTLPGGERLTFVGPPITAPGIVSLTMRLVRNTIRTMSAYDGSDFFDSADWLNRHDVLPRLDELDAPRCRAGQFAPAQAFARLFADGRAPQTNDWCGGRHRLRQDLLDGIPDPDHTDR